MYDMWLSIMVNVEGGAKETNKMLNMFLGGGGSSL